MLLSLDEIKLPLRSSLIEYLGKILIYLSKMSTFSHELITRPNPVLASAIYFIGLKTLEQVNKSFVPEDVLPCLSRMTGISEEEILSAGREVLQLAKTFSKLYPNLNNLKKFNRFEYREE